METSKKSYQSLSAEIVEQNVDLLNMILLRVPAKSLVRFKCVSKCWLSLISNSKFANDHTRNKLNKVVSGLYIHSRPIINFTTNSPNGHQSLPKFNFLSTINQSGVFVLHSYNGLTLCYRCPDIIVCNLTTQQFKVIPSFHSPFPNLPHEWFISFNPENSPHYKVVLLLLVRVNDLDGPLEMGVIPLCSYHVNIYSSESRTWKKILFGPRAYPYSDMVFCDGSIYWFDLDKKILKFNIDEEERNIVHLRPIDEEEQNIRLYPFIWGDNLDIKFGESGGRLFVVQAYKFPVLRGLLVLEMDMHTFYWYRKFTIDLGPAINTLPAELDANELWGVGVLCLKDHMLIFGFNGKITSYDRNSDPAKFLDGVLCDARESNNHVHKFIESLATI